MTTAVVVPSPISCSCVLATSTTIFAAGCSTWMFSRMVTPSFVIVMSPKLSTIILSMPFGPSVVRTVSATSLAARMLFFWAFLPLVRCVPSGMIKIGWIELLFICPLIFLSGGN